MSLFLLLTTCIFYDLKNFPQTRFFWLPLFKLGFTLTIYIVQLPGAIGQTQFSVSPRTCWFLVLSEFLQWAVGIFLIAIPAGKARDSGKPHTYDPLRLNVV